jgi:hypothetical protein
MMNDNWINRVRSLKFKGIKNIITSVTSRVVSIERDIKESQRKITEVESGIQGVGNLFDNLKTVCEKNRNASCVLQGVLDTTLCDKVCRWLEVDRWFSTGTPISSTNKTHRYKTSSYLIRSTIQCLCWFSIFLIQ